MNLDPAARARINRAISDSIATSPDNITLEATLFVTDVVDLMRDEADLQNALVDVHNAWAAYIGSIEAGTDTMSPFMRLRDCMARLHDLMPPTAEPELADVVDLPVRPA